MNAAQLTLTRETVEQIKRGLTEILSLVVCESEEQRRLAIEELNALCDMALRALAPAGEGETPECDEAENKEAWRQPDTWITELSVAWNLARRLERQRDEARRELNQERATLADTTIRNLELQRERDEARREIDRLNDVDKCPQCGEKHSAHVGCPRLSEIGR